MHQGLITLDGTKYFPMSGYVSVIALDWHVILIDHRYFNVPALEDALKFLKTFSFESRVTASYIGRATAGNPQ